MDSCLINEHYKNTDACNLNSDNKSVSVRCYDHAI